ncbi:MAG: hypothetical protein ACWGOY_15185 [Anaerolineales bacterium]
MAEQEKKGYGHFKDHVPSEAREHARNAREEMRKSWAALLPPEFIAHRRQARKEMLLAARELINHALEHLEKVDEMPD